MRQRRAEQRSDQPSSSSGSLPQCAIKSLRLRARSDKGFEEDGRPPSPPRDTETLAHPDAEDTPPLSALDKTITELGLGRYGHTLKVRLSCQHHCGLCILQVRHGIASNQLATICDSVSHVLPWLQRCYDGRDVAIKAFNLKLREAAAAYSAESSAYKGLEDLQGKAIPLLYNGLMEHINVHVIETMLHGTALAEDEKPEHLHKAMRAALQAIPQRMATSAGPFFEEGECCVDCRFDLTVLQASKAERVAEMQRLKDMLAS